MMRLRRKLRSKRGRRASALAGLAVIALVQVVLPASIFASGQTSSSVRVRPGDAVDERPFLPGTEALARRLLARDSGLRYFHPPPGTYDPAGPTPEAAAASIQNRERESGEQPPDFEVLKVYSIVKIADHRSGARYAVRYQTNLNMGFYRNLDLNELIDFNPQTGGVSWGGATFVDPIYAIRFPEVDPTWGTVVGGAAAVAAAAIALAAALAGGGAAAAGATAASGRPEGDQAPDPDQAIGHILQLSTKRLDLSLGKTKRLDASVWRVKADGSYLPAPECEIILEVPEGFASSSTRGRGSLSVNIQQVEPTEAALKMVVYVNGPQSGTTDFVDLFGSAEARLDIDVARFDFLVGTKESVEVLASVANPGEEQWQISALWRHDKKMPVGLTVHQEKPADARVELTEAATQEDIGEHHYVGGDLRILARAGEQELERRIPVILNQEGLFVASFGASDPTTLALAADGKQETREMDFRILIWDPQKRELQSDTSSISSLSFTPRPEGHEAKKALEVAEVVHEFVQVRTSNLSSGTYRFHLENEVPGRGQAIRLPLLVAVEGKENERGYSREITLKMDLAAIDPEAAAYQLEFERCQTIIDKHVPEDMKPRMQSLLDNGRVHMGADGLYQLRQDIWMKAHDAWLAEGESYRRHAKFLDWCVYALEWAEWAGDKAFELVVKKKLLVLSGGNKWVAANGTRLASFIKKLMAEALGEAIAQRRSPIAWLNERFMAPIDALSRVMFDLGDEAWSAHVNGLTPASLERILRRQGIDPNELSAAAKQSCAQVAAQIEAAVIKEVKHQIWTEGKKALKSKLEQYELQIVGNGWRMSVPVWAIIWVFEQSYSFYDNYVNKKMSFLQAARATSWSVVDSSIWGYLGDVAVKKRWNFEKGGIVARGDEDFHTMLGIEQMRGEKVSVLRTKLNSLQADMEGLRPIPHSD